MQGESVPNRLCVVANEDKHPATGPYMLGIANRTRCIYEQYWMQMRDSSKLVKKSCTAKGRHDARQGASAKSLLPCCIHHYARVMSNFRNENAFTRYTK